MRFPSFRRPAPVVQFTTPDEVDSILAVCFKPRFEFVGLPEMIAVQAEMEPRLYIAVTTPDGDAAESVMDLISFDEFNAWIAPLSEFPPLPTEPHMSHKLSDEEREHLRQATHAYVIQWTSPPAVVPNVLPVIGAVAEAAAKYLGGVIYDPMTSSVVSIGSAGDVFATGSPIYKHIIVATSVGNRGLAWVTTHGLKKFGVPELQIVDAAPGLASTSGFLVNAVADRLARTVAASESATISVEAPIEISVNDLKVLYGEPPTDDGTPSVLVQLQYDHDEKSEMEPFLTIKPSKGFRGQFNEWLAEAVGTIKPRADKIVPILPNDDELLAAHRRALDELPTMREQFNDGLEPGDVFYIKHGFADDTGEREFMWVTVNTWRSGVIKGQLMNEPADCAKLRAGQTVSIPEGDVYDWLLVRHSGERLGGYTSEVLVRLQERDAEAG
ncbi:MAG TPA: DUF2314 domain-containing protein [Capsulimonadaceae bacterium]|jgi:uncharacterized protein YegJ (DUF2314 family)